MQGFGPSYVLGSLDTVDGASAGAHTSRKLLHREPPIRTVRAPMRPHRCSSAVVSCDALHVAGKRGGARSADDLILTKITGRLVPASFVAWSAHINRGGRDGRQPEMKQG